MHTDLRRDERSRNDWTALAAVGFLALLGLVQTVRAGQPAEKPPEKEKGPIGQFVTVDSPVDDSVSGTVMSAALALQARAQREGRPGVLVLEINPGRSSAFHHVMGLAKFLVGPVRDLKTVAWVPRTVQGNHAVLALACDEIVLKDGAALGDIGLPPTDVAERTFVLTLADDRHNPKINAALILGMLDAERRLVWAKTDVGTMVLTEEEFDKLSKAGKPILKTAELKAAGVPGLFTSEQAKSYEIVAEHVLLRDAERADVARKYQLPREAMHEQAAAVRARKATVIRVDDVVDTLSEQFVHRQIDRAVTGGADLLIFEIDSPQGRIYPCLNLADAIIAVSERKIRTVAFVPRQALGGSAVIALACDELYVSPKAELGEIQPPFNDRPKREDLERQRVTLRDKLADLAKQKKRPPVLLRAMADESVVAYVARNQETGETTYLAADEFADNPQWVRGEPLPETSGRELLRLDGRKAQLLGLAEATPEDVQDLKRRLGLSAIDVPVAQRTWVDNLVFTLNTPTATFMLFIVGVLFAYLEMHFGVGIFGISSIVCFTLFFWSRFLGGTADWLEVSLFLLGLGCLALELFVLPGFGVFGVSGIILVLFSLVLASQTFVIPASQSDLSNLTRNFGTLGGSIVAVFIVGAVLSRYLPHMPFFEGMVLTPPGGDTANEPKLNPVWVDASAAGTLLSRNASLVGCRGVATTLLRPAGKAQIGDDLLDVVSEGVFISAGRPVEVVSVEGTVVVVRPLEA